MSEPSTSRSYLTAALMLAAGLVATAWSAPARADAKLSCSESYQKTQALRKDARLRQARDEAIACSQEACPDFIRADCAEWLAQIDANLPTLVFLARDASGGDVSDVKVHLDGEILKERIDGKSVAVDPGEHVVRFEMAGASPVEQRLVIRQGEKNRTVSVSFAPLMPPPRPTSRPLDPTGEAVAKKSTSGRTIATYSLAGLGVVGAGMFATFGALGLSERSDLEKSCAPTCSDAQVSGAKTKFLIADISLGVGVVSLGIATYLFFSAPSNVEPPKSARLRFDLAPAPGGGLTTLSGAF